LSAVQLDGSLTDAQFKCNLLVETSRNDQAHDLPLARRQRTEALTKLLELGALRARFAIHLQRLPDRVYELGFPHRLGQEVNSAGLESLYRHGYVTAAREEDHRHSNAGDVHFRCNSRPFMPGMFTGRTPLPASSPRLLFRSSAAEV